MSAVTRQPRNTRAVAALIQALTSGGVTPFIGAGLSVPFGFPGWVPFLTHCADRAGIDISPQIGRGQFEEAAEGVLAAKGRTWFDRQVSRVFGRAPARLSNVAAGLLPLLGSGPVVTTNFDRVLEEVFRVARSPFAYEIWGGRPVLAERVVKERLHVLIKIHGDASTTDGRVLTRREYDAQYGMGRKRTGLATLLLHLFAAQPVLFLGCRLEHDRYLRLIARAGAPPGRWHFALLPRRSGVKWLHERTRYLRTLRILPLWYDDGDFDAVREFLRELCGLRRSPRATHTREVDRRVRSVNELERRLTENLTVDEKIETFFINQNLLIEGGLARDYVRIASPLLRLARRTGRDCASLNIANNIAAILSADDPRRRQVMRLCARLAKLCHAPELLDDFWFNTAVGAERQNPLAAKRIYRRLSRSPRTSLAVVAFRRLAVMASHAGLVARARRLFLKSIERAEGSPSDQARAWTDLGAMLDDHDDLDGAEDAYRRAAKISRRTGSADSLARALNNLAVIALQREKWERAYALTKQALGYAQTAGRESLVTVIRGNQAEILYRQAMFSNIDGKPVREILKELAEVYEHLTDTLVRERGAMRGRNLTQRALTTVFLKDVPTALTELRAAAQILRRHGELGWLWTNYFNRGVILWDDGQVTRAARALRVALRLATLRHSKADAQRTQELLARCEAELR